MSYGSGSNWDEDSFGTSDPQPINHNGSVMREFLESDIDFEWPEGLGERLGNHCKISQDVRGIPLKWKKKISDRASATIDSYEAGPGFSFQRPFVVKTIRGKKARKLLANEVENMKDLRHPHVTALLATFTYQARLHILIFPAACCDLEKFMKQISKGLDKEQTSSHSDATNTFDSDTTSSRNSGDFNTGSGSKHKENGTRGNGSEPWPLSISIDRQIGMLRGYFVCLSQALSYLHNSGVRHKDIKPANILIDESGSVILTDFGISRRFPKHSSHATNNERKFTRKYASPEIMNDENSLRDDPSDVFSLGCVFLEIATLVLGKGLNSLSYHYATTINESGKEEAYYCNLKGVFSWIDHLRTLRGFRPVQEQLLLEQINQSENFLPGPENQMTAALIDVRRMLDMDPLKRPVSTGLWQGFQHISAIKCRDCDPRRPADMWKPSARQRRVAQTGLENRRSLNATEGKHLRDIRASASKDMNNSMAYSTPLIRDRSLRRSRRVSFPGTSQQSYIRHGHIRMRSEPASRTPHLNGDILEAARAVRSPSPKFESEIVLEKKHRGIVQAAAITPPATVNHETPTHVESQIPGRERRNWLLRVKRLQATKLGLSHRRSIRRDQQSRVTNPRRETGKGGSSAELQEYNPPAQMRILVFDVSRATAFETVYASVKDQDFILYPVSRFRRKVVIGDKADLIAVVEFKRLNFRTQIRHWKGSFPFIYVLNHAAQPLQTENRLDTGG